jgi:hypothetical protein
MNDDVAAVAGKLTEKQKRAILALSGDWQFGGYDSIQADILWAMDAIFLQPAIVEQRLLHPEGRYPRYEHRLSPFGEAVRTYLKDQSNAD